MRVSSHVLCLLSFVESTKPKQVYDGKLDFVSERTIKDIIIIVTVSPNWTNAMCSHQAAMCVYLLFLQEQIKDHHHLHTSLVWIFYGFSTVSYHYTHVYTKRPKLDTSLVSAEAVHKWPRGPPGWNLHAQGSQIKLSHFDAVAFSDRPIKSCFRSHRRAPSLHSVRQRFENGGVCVCPVPIVS